MTFRENSIPEIFLCTSVDQSSITIPDVICVIDFCLVKYMEKSPTFEKLIMAWAAKNSLKQRAGKVSQTREGEVFRLIFKSMYSELDEIEKPQMLREQIERNILKIKDMNFRHSIRSFLKLSPAPPSAKHIKAGALHTLKELGGLHRLSKSREYDYNDGEITNIGRIMASLPVDIRISKFIVLGYMFSILDEAIIIGAEMSTLGIFIKKNDSSSHDFMTILKATICGRTKNNTENSLQI